MLRDCLDSVVVVLVAMRADERTVMEHADINLPPGFRFHPTDDELVGFFLMHKILNSNHCWARVIPEVNLHKCEPWDLPGVGKKGEKDRYYFSLRDRKYPSGRRSNRATEAGYWKATGKDRRVLCSHSSRPIGLKKTLVFYTGRAPRGEKTNWIMHEYRLEADSEWVICRVFHRISGHNNSSHSASICSFEDPSLPQLLDVSRSTSIDNRSVPGGHEVKDSSIPCALDIKPQLGSLCVSQKQNAATNVLLFGAGSNGDVMALLDLPSDHDNTSINPACDRSSSFISNVDDKSAHTAELDVTADSPGSDENIDKLIHETSCAELCNAVDSWLYGSCCLHLCTDQLFQSRTPCGHIIGEHKIFDQYFKLAH
ncbi:hypothetical protein O6H91_01G166200 [Diphasiastrum complanatum]|uniref:Uncharacterized protein n=1 Tax=Diphasiastrum complanatum TaxID=34168 RepID=A0ACC2EYG4_DIPCM|nr:hypothetical protein O6H91_01G166200 [Diphasiastrum complanatum]